MNKHILADYYEHNLLIKKAQKLRRKSFKILFGEYLDYNRYLGKTSDYKNGDGGYYYNHGSGWFDYGNGYGYIKGNGLHYNRTSSLSRLL